MVPDLTHSKLLRVNTTCNTMLVWFGGENIKEYSLNTKDKEEIKTHTIHCQKPNYPSFREVKKRMREIIEMEEKTHGKM